MALVASYRTRILCHRIGTDEKTDEAIRSHCQEMWASIRLPESSALVSSFFKIYFYYISKNNNKNYNKLRTRKVGGKEQKLLQVK